LRLKQRGREFSIMLGSNELMNSHLSGSEQALATLACERIQTVKAPSVLIGGLGMGFTLRAALANVPHDASVTVAELVPAVVRWARGPMADLFGGCLDDPRVTVLEADVQKIIRSARGAHDAILLDVDNGPDGISTSGNDRLYTHDGLLAARMALKPSGVLAVWSAHPDAAFARRLRSVFAAVNEHVVRANGRGGGAKHIIWLAMR
jgi:spermidine synthase